MNVILNRWDGRGFTDPKCVCWVCGKPASVIRLVDQHNVRSLRICAACLHEAQSIMNRAVLGHVVEVARVRK